MKIGQLIFGIAVLLAADANSHPQKRDSANLANNQAIDFSINNIMQKSIPHHQAMPGAVVLVARNGNILFSNSYGFSDIENKTPFNSESIFDLASCSKQFTAIGVLMLVDQGKLDLHEPIQKYLPEIQPNNGEKIKVIDLLHMTAGFHEYLDWFQDLRNVTNQEVEKKAANKQYEFPIGEKYRYSNTAYALLALLVERVSGESFSKYMSSHIFQPLGMNHTLVLDNPPMDIPNRVKGYTLKQKEFKPVRCDTHIVGDGQVFTTAQDLVLWDKGLRDGKLLKEETLRHAYASGRLNNGKETKYGMGYETSQEYGKNWVWHTGGWTGTSTYISRCLDDGLLVIILSNNEKFDGAEHGGKIERLFEERENKSQKPRRRG
jgi:CubicO group peptidase (beta-lactamase class C family)